MCTLFHLHADSVTGASRLTRFHVGCLSCVVFVSSAAFVEVEGKLSGRGPVAAKPVYI